MKLSKESNNMFYNLVKNSSICDNIITIIYDTIKPYMYFVFFFFVINILLLLIIISDIIYIKKMFKKV